MSMIVFAIEEAESVVLAWEDWRINGCTIRLGEYVLITCAACGSQITWLCGMRSVDGGVERGGKGATISQPRRALAIAEK
jgi:hypothetical protein